LESKSLTPNEETTTYSITDYGVCEGDCHQELISRRDVSLSSVRVNVIMICRSPLRDEGAFLFPQRITGCWAPPSR